jgi:hypothetical protein
MARALAVTLCCLAVLAVHVAGDCTTQTAVNGKYVLPVMFVTTCGMPSMGYLGFCSLLAFVYVN